MGTYFAGSANSAFAAAPSVPAATSARQIKYLAPTAPLANLASTGEPRASSAPSARWLDIRRTHEQQKQTTTNRTTMGDRLTYFGVDNHAKSEIRKLRRGRPIEEGEITNDK